MPDMPLHKRTERDVFPDAAAELRVRSTSLLRRKAAGLVSPSLTSSYAGSIDRILFAFPRYATGAALSAG